jgi:hypothetical protein
MGRCVRTPTTGRSRPDDVQDLRERPAAVPDCCRPGRFCCGGVAGYCSRVRAAVTGMQFRMASIAGDEARENEDYAGVLGSCAVVPDGSGLPGDLPSGCVHGVPWYVCHLGAGLLARMALDTEASLPDALAGAIE